MQRLCQHEQSPMSSRLPTYFGRLHAFAKQESGSWRLHIALLVEFLESWFRRVPAWTFLSVTFATELFFKQICQYFTALDTFTPSCPPSLVFQTCHACFRYNLRTRSLPSQNGDSAFRLCNKCSNYDAPYFSDPISSRNVFSIQLHKVVVQVNYSKAAR